MSLISEDNPGNKSSQQAGHRYSWKQHLNHKSICGMKSYQTYELKIGMLLDNAKNFPIIRALKGWHQLLKENRKSCHYSLSAYTTPGPGLSNWCVQFHCIHTATLWTKFTIPFNKHKTHSWKCLESGFKPKTTWLPDFEDCTLSHYDYVRLKNIYLNLSTLSKNT